MNKVSSEDFNIVAKITMEAYKRETSIGIDVRGDINNEHYVKTGWLVSPDEGFDVKYDIQRLSHLLSENLGNKKNGIKS